MWITGELILHVSSNFSFSPTSRFWKWMANYGNRYGEAYISKNVKRHCLLGQKSTSLNIQTNKQMNKNPYHLVFIAMYGVKVLGKLNHWSVC